MYGKDNYSSWACRPDAWADFQVRILNPAQQTLLEYYQKFADFRNRRTQNPAIRTHYTTSSSSRVAPTGYGWPRACSQILIRPLAVPHQRTSWPWSRRGAQPLVSCRRRGRRARLCLAWPGTVLSTQSRGENAQNRARSPAHCAQIHWNDSSSKKQKGGPWKNVEGGRLGHRCTMAEAVCRRVAGWSGRVDAMHRRGAASAHADTRSAWLVASRRGPAARYARHSEFRTLAWRGKKSTKEAKASAAC